MLNHSVILSLLAAATLAVMVPQLKQMVQRRRVLVPVRIKRRSRY